MVEEELALTLGLRVVELTLPLGGRVVVRRARGSSVVAILCPILRT
jgi:hypothetical protein